MFGQKFLCELGALCDPILPVISTKLCCHVPALPQLKLLTLRLAVLSDVVFDFEFSSGVFAGHVPDFAEDRSLRPPGSVVATQHPEDTGVLIWIPPIDRIFIVELNHDPQGFARRL